MHCVIDEQQLPEGPDGVEWVDDDFFGWVHRTSFWHTVDGTRLRKLRGALAFVEVPDPGQPARPSPPAVDERDLEPD